MFAIAICLEERSSLNKESRRPISIRKCNERVHCQHKVQTMHRLIPALMWLGLMFVLQGCAETSTQRMIDANDHNGLANYYTQQAKQLSVAAKQWEFTAEYYERHSEPHGKTEPKQHAAHCRAIAQSFANAAEEAEALAQEHRAMRSHGAMQ
jgi:hypothetical protein